MAAMADDRNDDEQFGRVKARGTLNDFASGVWVLIRGNRVIRGLIRPVGYPRISRIARWKFWYGIGFHSSLFPA